MTNKNTKHISEIKKNDNLIIDGYVIFATSDAYMATTDNGKEWNFESGDDYYYASSFKNGLVDVYIGEIGNGYKVPVPYISVWDGGIEVETTANVDIRTGKITDIINVDVTGLDICERQYIVMQGEQVDVYEDERGYEYWADIKNEISGEKNDMCITTTKCINGILKESDLVISTPDDDYSCLIGRVTKINLLDTPEHDETENETDDVHVNFFEFDYSKKRMDEIAENFSELYGEKKEFYDCPLDDVIMDPCSLIRIIGTDETLLSDLLNSRYNSAVYCYGIVNTLRYQTDPEIMPVPNEMKCMNHATSGFKIMRIINGQKVCIELTYQEVSNAFSFQEHNYNIMDIKATLEEIEEKNELPTHTAESIYSNDALMGKIVSDYEESLEEHDTGWHELVLTAINENIKNTEPIGTPE